MKFIPIMEISSQIMTLIEEAEKEIIIVSPYVDIKIGIN
jgi:phosphatidylserine/phosphatidylglycerophosphate/cardiolipin synthase-like enzyme